MNQVSLNGLLQLLLPLVGLKLGLWHVDRIIWRDGVSGVVHNRVCRVLLQLHCCLIVLSTLRLGLLLLLETDLLRLAGRRVHANQRLVGDGLLLYWSLRLLNRGLRWTSTDTSKL